MISTLAFPIFTSESKILNNNKLSLHICERILQKKFIVNEGVEKINVYTKSPNLPSPFWSKTVGQELLGWPPISQLKLNSAQKMEP